MITSLSSRPATTPILTALRRISILQNAAKRSLCVQGRRSGIQKPVFVRAFSSQPVIADAPPPGKIATTFEPWWSAEDIEAGIETGTVRYGRLHVPAFETGQASVELDADDDGRRVRVKVPGFMARNRAVHGDRVAVRLMWRAYKRDDSGSDGTGEDEASVGRVEDARARVVAVVRRSEVPVVGVARPGETKIQPRDQRLPAMDLIQPFFQVDEGVHLVACEIVDWEEASVNPKCKLVPHLQRESLDTERSGIRTSALLYGIAVTIEEALYHQITERDVEILLAAMATLGDDEFCSERCRVLLSLHHGLVPTAAPNGLAVCSLYGAMVRLGIRLLEEDLSEDSSLYGFALLWSVLSSAPPEWLVSTLGLVGVRATSALRSAGKRKRSEEEELNWIPYLARYLEKLKRAVPTPALRKYSPIIAAELISRYWSGNKKQRTAVGGENLADDKVDEVIASSLYPLLCEGSTGTKQHAGEATSYKSDDVLHLFASAGSDSSREKVKRMLQMYNQRFRYKGRV